jgi:hypothetical protein
MAEMGHGKGMTLIRESEIWHPQRRYRGTPGAAATVILDSMRIFGVWAR